MQPFRLYRGVKCSLGEGEKAESSVLPSSQRRTAGNTEQACRRNTARTLRDESMELAAA